jgi:hypothetical protein
LKNFPAKKIDFLRNEKSTDATAPFIATFLSRVARSYIFIPKIPIWVNLVKQRKMSVHFMATWNIIRPCGTYGHFEKFVVIWYIYPVLVYLYYQRDLAALLLSHFHKRISLRRRPIRF